jgi:VWFA-related protein
MSRWLLASLLLVVGGAVGVAQQPASPKPAGEGGPASPQGDRGVTFRAETNFVDVHAIVTDRSGGFVRDLKADDFEIYEDGRPQKPSAFSLIELPVERPATLASAGEIVEPDIRVASRTFAGRIYIFLLDDLHTAVTRSQLVKDTARRFVERYLGSDDLAAVVYTSGRTDAGQELTSSRKLLIAAINRFVGRKLPSVGAEKLAVHLRDLDLRAGDDTDNPQPGGRTREGLDRALSTRDPDEAERGLNARRTLQAVENVSRWMADVQGRRKALLLFSEGIDYDIYDPFNRDVTSSLVTDAQRAIGAAQRANVNIYGVDPRGLDGFGDLADISGRSDYPQLEYGQFRGFMHELRLSQESLFALSDQTGGLAVVNTGDVAGGLGRVVLDNSRYYLLGYYSDSKRWSRKFMKIEVRVKRPGLQVRARRGFLPPDTKAATKTTVDAKAGTSPALAAALARPVPIGGVPLRVFATALRGSGPKAAVIVAAELDGAALKFTQRDGRFIERVELSIVATDEDAKVQGGDRQQFDMNLLPDTHARVSRSGVRLISHLDLPPGRYQIRVGAFETTGGAIATVPYDIEVPDYTKASFAMSGIVLSSSDADAVVNANPDPQLKDLMPATPVVTRTFGRAQTLTAFAEVYDNASTLALDLMLVATVRDAADRVVFRAQDRRTGISGARSQGFTTDIPLKDFAPGTYVLRLDATSAAGGYGEHRSIPFEVR